MRGLDASDAKDQHCVPVSHSGCVRVQRCLLLLIQVTRDKEVLGLETELAYLDHRDRIGPAKIVERWTDAVRIFM